MNKIRPSVSVCMASFNGEKYIKQQIVSILQQLNADDELIISDDNSEDSTVAIIHSLNDNRIKWHININSPSIIANFENSVSRASGEYIFLADQDDIWIDNKVDMMVHYLTNFDLVVSDCMFINSDGEVQADSYQKLYKSGRGFIKNIVKNSFLGNCMAFKSDMRDIILPFPKELHMASRYHIYHDVWIGLMLSLTCSKVIFIPLKLSLYRRHESNASPTSTQINRSPNTISQKIIGRYWIVLAVLKRLLLITSRFFT